MHKLPDTELQSNMTIYLSLDDWAEWKCYNITQTESFDNTHIGFETAILLSFWFEN